MNLEVLFVAIPVYLLWLVVLVDVLIRPDLRVLGKVSWIAAVTLVWPTMILYLLLRPVDGRFVAAASVRRREGDPRQQLVTAVLDKESGRIDQFRYQATVNRLRGLE